MAVFLVLLCLLSLSTSAFAQWSEPVIDGSLRTGPLDAPPVTDQTFYVDGASLGGTCNNGNAGTNPAQPKCSIGSALSVVGPGDLILVRAATYTEGGLQPGVSGTAGNYITIRAYPGDPQPHINCAGQTWCMGRNRAYVVWDGFEFTGPNQQFLVCQTSQGCHHFWIRNSKLHDNNQAFTSGSIQVNADHFVFSNNEIYNTPSEGVGAGTTASFNIIFEFNHVHHNGWNGDDIGGLKCGDNNTYNCVIRYNIAHDNYRDPAIATTPPFNGSCYQGITGLYIDVGDGPTAQPGTQNWMYNNLSYNNDVGLQIYYTQSARVFNNVVYHNGFTPGFTEAGWCHNEGGVQNYGAGITSESNRTVDLQVYNNIVYGNRKRGINAAGIATGAYTSRNNIVMNNEPNFAQFAVSNANHNYDLIAGTGVAINWNGTNYATLAAFLARGGNTTWLNAVGTPATFVNAAGGNFHYVVGSAGINQGTTGLVTYDHDNGTRPQGAAWDIGAYEFSTLSAPPTVTITTNGGAGAGVNFATATTPLSPILQGTASDDVAVSSVTWACPTCTPTSGTATGTTSWSVATIGLASGANVLTVTATDGDSQSAQDTLTVTYTVVTSVPPVLRLVR